MMKCSDIENILAADDYDIEIVENHLKSCPICAVRFAADVKIEKSLRGLAEMTGTIDVSDEIQNVLLISQKNQHRMKFVRRWVWGAAFAACAAIILFTAPTIIGWLKDGYAIGLAMIDKFEFLERIDIEAMLNSILTENIRLPFLIGLGSFLALIF
jgi:hypothetical protein